MAEREDYVTKMDANIEDWLVYNGDYFARLKGEGDASNPGYTPFVDVDRHAAEAGVSTESYFEHVKKEVGPLGRAGLQLVHSEMDGAWHIVVGPIE